jgi:hypothetical protein
VAKVTINGETYTFDRAHRPLAEAMALEKALDIPYGQWEQDLQEGSARALAGFCWLVWRRAGKNVPFEDIESGEAEIDVAGFEVEEDPDPGPTTRETGSGSSGTGRAGTSSRSPASASAPGKSASST